MVYVMLINFLRKYAFLKIIKSIYMSANPQNANVKYRFNYLEMKIFLVWEF